MYLEIDLYTPIHNAYLVNKKVKNLILRHWPRKVVNSVEVFDRFTFYNGAVVNTAQAQAIYKVLGTSYSELNANQYSGVEYAWMYLKPYHLAPPTISEVNIEAYIDSNSVLDQEYTVLVTYNQQTAKEGLTSLTNLTNAQIVSLIEGGYNSYYSDQAVDPIIYNVNTGEVDEQVYESHLITYQTGINPVTFASLMDTTDVLFTSESKVLTRSILPIYSTKKSWDPDMDGSLVYEVIGYTINVIVEYKYTRTISATDVTCDALITSIDANVTNMPVSKYSMYEQVSTMLHIVEPVLAGELLMTYSTSPIYGEEEGGGTTATYITIAGATELKAKDFALMLAASLDTDYAEESCSGWGCMIPIIVMIIIIVVVVIVTRNPTLAAQAAAAGTAVGGGTAGAIAAASVYLGAMSMVLALGSFIMTAIAMVLRHNGQYGMAIAFRNSIVVLNNMAMVVGALAMVTGVMSIINGIRHQATVLAQEQAKEAGKAAARDSTSEVLVTSATVTPTLSNYVSASMEYAVTSTGGMFSGKSTGEILKSGVDIASKVADLYMKVVAPIKNPGMPEEDEPVVPTKLNDIEMVEIQRDMYGNMDLNRLMDNMPRMMTSDLVEDSIKIT